MEGPYEVRHNTHISALCPWEVWHQSNGSGLGIFLLPDEEICKDFVYLLNWSHKMRLLKEKETKKERENG